MHCPKCGQHQSTDETRFCSRCGLPLAAIATVVANDGQIPGIPNDGIPKGASPRRRGVMKGLFFFLLAFLVVPIITMITIAAGVEPYFVVAATVIFTVGGLLRVAYALMFESSDAVETVETGTGPFSVKGIGGKLGQKALPAEQSIPASAYTAPQTGRWRDTNELAPEPGSVTDNTTKLLERDQ